MKFAIFGLTITPTWSNGHATLWRALCTELIHRGHEVTFFEHHVPNNPQHRDFSELPGGKVVRYANWNELMPLAKQELTGTDVAMITSDCPDCIFVSKLVLDSRAGIKTFYDLDTPLTLETLSTGNEVSYIDQRGLRDFDLVLTSTGGVAIAELETRLGAKRISPLYGHVDPGFYHPVAAREEFRSELSYLGNYDEDRQSKLEALLLEPAKQLPDKQFVIGGAHYPLNFPWTKNLSFVRHLPAQDHPAFFCSSRITLNVTRQSMAMMGYCPSSLLFEAAACGAPLLSDTWPGLNTFFTPGSEILIAEKAEDSINVLHLSDLELKKIGDAARERALAEHTSEKRAEYLERVIEDVFAGSRSPGLQLPDYSDTESDVPGAIGVSEIAGTPSGADRLQPGSPGNNRAANER